MIKGTVENDDKLKNQEFPVDQENQLANVKLVLIHPMVLLICQLFRIINQKLILIHAEVLLINQLFRILNQKLLLFHPMILLICPLFLTFNQDFGFKKT